MMRIAEKRVMLNQIDMDWRNHLQAMDNLKSSVGLRSIAGKDPYNEYKMEYVKVRRSKIELKMYQE